ncbi:hypothetical protein D3C80_955600 [compost metagenome]
MRPRGRLSKRDAGRRGGRVAAEPLSLNCRQLRCFFGSRGVSVAAPDVRRLWGSTCYYASFVDRRLRCGPVGRAGRVHGPRRRIGADPLGRRPPAQRQRRADREELGPRLRRRAGGDDQPRDHRPRQADALQGHRRHPDGAQRRGHADGQPVLRGLYAGRSAGRPPPDHLYVQRRTRFADGVAAHGRLRPGAGPDRRSPGRAPGALQRRPERHDPAGQDRPGLHRHGRGRLFAPAGRHARLDLLGRGSGRGHLRPRHHALHDQVQPVVQPEIRAGRKLRHPARRRPGAPAGKPRDVAERRGPAVVDHELRRAPAGLSAEFRHPAADLCRHGLVSQQGAEPPRHGRGARAARP